MATEIKSPTDAEIFRDWLQSVPYGQYKDVRSEIMKECLINRTTLNNWLNGLCRIPLSGKRDINKVTKRISGKEIFIIANPE